MGTLTVNPATTLPATMTVREASELLGISLRATYRAIEADQLPVIRVGRRIYVITHKLYSMLGVPVIRYEAGPEDAVADPAGADRPATERTYGRTNRPGALHEKRPD